MYCVFHHIYGQFQGKFCKTWEWPTSLLEHLVTLKIVKRRHPPFLWKSITKGFISLLMSTHLRQASPLILHSFLSKWPYFCFVIFTINILCWIDLVSPQFFPSMHPLTHFAIQAWGAEKMRCQNIIISSSSLQGGGYYPPRLSEENIRICRTNGQSQASNGNLNLNQ